MSTPQTNVYDVDIKFKGRDNFNIIVQRFYWKSMINNGFMIRCVLQDPTFDVLDTIFTEQYLKTGRDSENPLEIIFKLKWREGAETKERTAIITDMRSTGSAGYGGGFEFIAIDPASYWLNRGEASGKMYEGKIGDDDGVIAQVLGDYLPGDIAFYISKTTDQKAKYWMMRQDPKTFISTLLDWSSSFTENKTQWVVSSGEDLNGPFISIEEGYTPDLKDPASVQIEGGNGPLIFKYGGANGAAGDIIKWKMLTDNFLVTLNNKLTTSGISTVSGKYYDRKFGKNEGEKQVVFIEDKNTDKKVNPKFGQDRGFSKPKNVDKGWTHILAIPEFSAADVGAPYDEYISGRARQLYINLANSLMRIKVTVRGEPRLYDSYDLGRSKVTLAWLGVENGNSRFMDGQWLLYGWEHKLTSNWSTDVYLARLDYDAAAKPGS